MRPGDVIRIADTKTGIADQTTVANVTAQRPLAISANTIVIHGTAQDASGHPLSIDQIEHRLIANRDLFELNGRRTLRAAAGADGTLSYDPIDSKNPQGINWTATYTLSPTDMVRAVGGATTVATTTTPAGTVFVGAESRAMWLGRDPLAATELTTFENGPGVVGGSSAPCTAPAETPAAAATFTPTTVSFGGVQTNTSSTAFTVTFSNGGGAPMTMTGVYIAGLNPGDFSIANNNCPASLGAGNSCAVNVTFTPTASGLRQGNLSFSNNAANTTDQTVALSGTGTDATQPNITVSPASLSFGTVNGGESKNQTVTVTNSGAGTLTISAATATGTAAADFPVVSAVAQDCASLAAKASCSITVQFRPGAIGARTATLTISHSATGTGATSTSVALTGTGGGGSVLSFNANPIKFGTVNRNANQDQTITVKNSGNAAATLGDITVTGTGYTLPSTTNTTCIKGSSLATNKTCNVVVRFNSPNLGTFNGTLSVTAGNGLPPTVSTSLTATTK
jgi:hypothetical protein